jgi:hypothetical protein
LTKLALTVSQPKATPDAKKNEKDKSPVAETYVVSADVTSAKLTAKLGATYTLNQLLDVREGSSIDLSLSPEAYAALAPKNTAGGMSLANDASINVKLRGTQIVWKSGVGEDGKAKPVIDAEHSQLGIDITASANFKQAEPAITLGLNDLLITVDSASLAKKLDVRMQGSASTAGAGGKKSSKIKSDTQLTMALGDDLAFQNKTATIKSNTNFPDVPVAALDAILRKNGDLIDLLGDTVSLVVNVERHPDTGGPVELDLKSGNLSANFKADIDKDQNVKLREDGIAMVKITPKIATKYLAKLNPVLKDVQSAKDPVKLTVKKDRFFFPLVDADITKRVVIGSLDLGTMHMKRGEVGGYLVKAMRELGSPIQDREEFDAVFTKLEFTMEKGVVTSNDVWFDAGDVILGTQARVNQAVNPSDPTTEVLIGIPGELVRLVPGASKRVPVTALYEVTGAGPLSKISYDYMALTTEFAKIAAEATGNKTVSQIAGGLSVASQVGTALFGEKEKKERAAKGIKGWDGATWPNRPKTGRAPVVDAKAAPGAPGDAAAPATGGTTGAANPAVPSVPTKDDAASQLLEALKNAATKEKAEKPVEKPKAAKPVAPEAETIGPTPAAVPAPVPVEKPTPKAEPAPIEKPKAKVKPEREPEPAPVEKPKAKAKPEPEPEPAPVEKPKTKAVPDKAKPGKNAAPETQPDSATTAPADEPAHKTKPRKK